MRRSLRLSLHGALAVAVLSLVSAKPPRVPETIGDGTVSAMIPSGWVSWTPEEIALTAREDIPGLEIVAQCSEQPLGFAGFNPTLTVSRVDLNRLGLRRGDAAALAEELAERLTDFEPEGERPSPMTYQSLPAARISGRISLRAMGSEAEVAVEMITVVANGEGHVLTALTLAEESIASPPAEPPRERLETPPLTSEETWQIGNVTLPLPPGWTLWTEAQVAQARRDLAVDDFSAVNGISRMRRGLDDFVPTVAIECQDWSAVGIMPDPVALCRSSSRQLLEGLPGGTWVMEPAETEIGGHPGALAVVEGRLLVQEHWQTIRFEHLWIALGWTALRVVIIMPSDAEEDREIISRMLSQLSSP
ncbi:hypothetical protein JXA47_03505 [Candidatus Sumerlaeota bacterium]|nr:hypothetical protein [Candidatus Sumerlaeota bacterium]